jgi:hypothetical protein
MFTFQTDERILRFKSTHSVLNCLKRVGHSYLFNNLIQERADASPIKILDREQ